MPASEEQFENLIRLVNGLSHRQIELEQRLDALEGKQPAAVPVPVAPEPPVPMASPPVVSPLLAAMHVSPAEPIAIPAAARTKPALESKVGLTVVNRIGVVTLVLGVAFFFKWAVDNNWIGPTGRVALGLLAGFAALAMADYLWRKSQQIFAQGITGTGLAIVYLSFYAAFEFYHLIPQSLAFLLLLATTITAATLALRYNAQAIAGLGLFGAYLIPLLLSNGEDHPWFLICFLLLINLAATELSRRRTWISLEVLSFLASTLIFGRWLLVHASQPDDHLPSIAGALALCAQRFRTALPLLFLFSQALATLAVCWNTPADRFLNIVALLITATGGLAFEYRRKYPLVVITAFISFWLMVGFTFSVRNYMLAGSAGFLIFAAWAWWRLISNDEKQTRPELVVLALDGAIYFAIAYSHLREDYHHWLGLLAVAVAAVYLAFGMLLSRRKGSESLDSVMLALGISVAFLSLAIPIQLVGFSVAIAWSIQGAALTWIAIRFRSTKAAIGALLIFALATCHLAAVDSLMYPDPNSYTLLFNMRSLVFAFFAAAVFASSYWVNQLGEVLNQESADRKLALIPFAAGHLAMLVGLGLEIVGWAQRTSTSSTELSRETIGITILMALYAVMLVGIGVLRKSPVFRLSGLLLTAIVVLKLYVFDVWQLQRLYQIIAFVMLGVLLLSTSFLYSRFKGLIDTWKQDEKTSL